MQLPEWINNNEAKALERIAAIEEYINDRELGKDKLRMQFNKDTERYIELTERAVTS